MPVKFGRFLAVACKHCLNGGSKRISVTRQLCVLQSFAKIGHIALGISGRPQRGSGESPFAGHQALEQAVKGMLTEARMNRHRHMDKDIAPLTNSVNPIVALFLNRWIPPARKVNDMSGCRQRQACPCGFRTKHQQVKPTILMQMSLKPFYNALSLLDGRVTIDQVDAT